MFHDITTKGELSVHEGSEPSPSTTLIGDCSGQGDVRISNGPLANKKREIRSFRTSKTTIWYTKIQTIVEMIYDHNMLGLPCGWATEVCMAG